MVLARPQTLDVLVRGMGLAFSLFVDPRARRVDDALPGVNPVQLGNVFDRVFAGEGGELFLRPLDHDESRVARESLVCARQRGLFRPAAEYLYDAIHRSNLLLTSDLMAGRITA